jgi:hypothetical protein
MQYEALMLPGWDLYFFRLCWFLCFLCLLEDPRIPQNVESRWSCIQTLFHFHPYLSQRIRWGRWPCNKGGKSQKPPPASAQLSGQNSRAAFLVRCCEWTAGAEGFRPTFLFWAVGAGEPRGFRSRARPWAPMFALSRPDGLPIGFCHAVTVLDSIAGALGSCSRCDVA